MARLANEARFGGNGKGGSWYANPPYPRSIAEAEASGYAAMFQQRAAWLVERFPGVTKVGIAGAGVGLTGYYLYTVHGVDPYMCDVNWAASIGAGVIPGGTSRIRALDILNVNQMAQFRRMGMNGNAKYPVLFVEDVLPCAESDAEAQAMLTNLRAVGVTLVHLITPLMPDTTQDSDMLWKSMAEWRALIGPGEVIVGPDLVEVP